MAKIAFDKYYTPPITAKWCIQKVKEIIGEENITEWVEPSAGSGSFSHQIKDCKAYDLYPQHEYIEQADFLKLKLGYKFGRLFIGNPPFGGSTGKLIKDFYNKCTEEGDYIAFILPANYYNNYQRFYKFEIIYSCIIETEYTNELIKTAFVIYKRNPDKDNYKEEPIELEDITIYRYARAIKNTVKKIEDIDYSFVYWGDIFKEAKPFSKAGVFGIKCNNPQNKKEILDYLKWLYIYEKQTGFIKNTCISAPVLSKDKIKRLLKVGIPNIK